MPLAPTVRRRECRARQLPTVRTCDKSPRGATTLQLQIVRDFEFEMRAVEFIVGLDARSALSA